MAEALDYPQSPGADYSVLNLNEYACLRQDFRRVIYVEYIGGPGRPPCTVVYQKARPEKPAHDFPWYAEGDVGFCENKARELVGRLRRAGWKCGLFRDVPKLGQRNAP